MDICLPFLLIWLVVSLIAGPLLGRRLKDQTKEIKDL